MGGAATITKEQENEVRKYLFGQLQEADEESIELRLLTDGAFVEEFDTIVDEVTDQYVRGELAESEREGFEKSFLATTEGQQKIRFATELLDRAVAERGAPAPTPKRAPGFFSQLSALWQRQSMRLAASAAAVVIIAGGIFLISKSINSGSSDYVVQNLTISTASRGDGAVPAKVKLDQKQAGLQVNLAIPEQARGATDYRVKLASGDRGARDLAVDKRDEQTVTVKIPASLIPRGSYAIQLFSVGADGTPQRINGNYYFDIE